MITPDSGKNLFKELNKQVNQPIYLYKVFDYDGIGGDLLFAEWDTDIVFDSVTYPKFPVTHDSISENNQGQIDAVKVRLSNVSRLIQSYLEEFDFRAKKVMIRLVFKDRLAYPDEKLDFYYFIDTYSASQDVVEFILLPKTDILSVTLPTRNYSRNYCGWKFKSTECGYAGAITTCNKTKQKCKELDNFQRFGGFPSIPSRKIAVI
ncbi:DUF2163 domain-containing protein [Candidatus Poribacteria bacterium]|nr:DUF2163 domain-containing protein [Candidatus Poribacteria bacterium]